MKKNLFIFTVFFSLFLLSGCASPIQERQANMMKNKQSRTGQYFELGSNAMVVAVAIQGVSIDGKVLDFAPFLSEAVRARFEAYDYHTGISMPFEDGVMGFEDLKLSGRTFSLNFFLFNGPKIVCNYIGINPPKFIVGEARELVFSKTYPDAEALFYGFQDELAPLLDELIDEALEVARREGFNP